MSADDDDLYDDIAASRRAAQRPRRAMASVDGEGGLGAELVVDRLLLLRETRVAENMAFQRMDFSLICLPQGEGGEDDMNDGEADAGGGMLVTRNGMGNRRRGTTGVVAIGGGGEAGELRQHVDLSYFQTPVPPFVFRGS
jgi:hypothetical protein